MAHPRVDRPQRARGGEEEWRPRFAPGGPPSGLEIDVWAVDLARPPVALADLEALLAADELVRADRFHFPRDRRRFVVRRGATRRLLASYLGRRPERLRFATGPNGKPSVEGLDAGGLTFNVTDSADLALIAVGVGVDLGVDVEWTERPRHTTRLVERFFSTVEIERWRTFPPELETAGFFRGWTCKEAYLKAIGTGLQTPLRHCTVELDPRRSPEVLAIGDDSDEAREWWLEELHPGEGFVGALARRTGPGTVRTYRWGA